MDDPIFAKAGRYKGRFFALVYGNAKIPKQELYTYLITNIKPIRGKTPIVFVASNSPYFSGDHMIALIDFHEKIDRSDFTKFNYEIHIPSLRRFDDWLKIITEVESHDPDIFPSRNQTVIESNAVIPTMYNCRLPNGAVATPLPVVTRKCSVCAKYVEISAFPEGSSECGTCRKNEKMKMQNSKSLTATRSGQAETSSLNSELHSEGFRDEVSARMNMFESNFLELQQVLIQENMELRAMLKILASAMPTLNSSGLASSTPTSSEVHEMLKNSVPLKSKMRMSVFDVNAGIAFLNFGDADRIIGRNTNFEIDTDDKSFVVFEITNNKKKTLEKYRKGFESNRYVNYNIDYFIPYNLTPMLTSESTSKMLTASITEKLNELCSSTPLALNALISRNRRIKFISEDDYGNKYNVDDGIFALLLDKNKVDLTKYIIMNSI